jgi:outer membrane receptor protein involved in Fe transport
MPGKVFAQISTSTLRGAAPANSTVTAKNAATGLTRSVQASADGHYVLVGLPPGDYEVDAGAGTKKSVQLAVATTAQLDLGAGQPEEALAEVVVRAGRLVQVRTSAVGNGVSLHQIETTPQVTRNFLEFADAVPGMVFDVDSRGNTSLRSGAQGPGATNVFIDGVGQKNYVRATGITGQGGSDSNQNPVGDAGNPFPQLAIGEYKVITSNYSAEFDQISGAAVTAVTRSGTNKFEGEAFYSFTNQGLRAQTPAEAASAFGKQGGPSKEFGFAVGGPIIQDKLHYFLTYEGKQFTLPNTVYPPGVPDVNGNSLDYLPWLTPDLRANYRPVANPFKETLVFGKLDWELSDNDRLEFSTKLRRERQQSGAQGNLAASTATDYLNDDNRFTLRWTRNAGRLLNEATFTYESTTDEPNKNGSKPGKNYVVDQSLVQFFGYDVVLQTDGLEPRSYFRAGQKGYGFQDDLTISNLNWHGEHILKAGFKFKSVDLQRRDSTTDPLYSYFISDNAQFPGGVPGVDAIPFQVAYGNLGVDSQPTVSTSKNRQYGIFLQDDWTLNDHVKFDLGVRYDYEQTPTFTNFVTPQRFRDSLFAVDLNSDPAFYTLPDGTFVGAPPGQTYDQSLAKGGININNYLSNGHNRKNPTNEIQPRLGVSFDINGDQRHVIFGGAGRSYDRNVFSILQHEVDKANLNVPTVQFWNAKNGGCLPGTTGNPNCVEWNDIYLTAAGLQTLYPQKFGEMHLINNNIKAPYSDQFSIGMRNRIGAWNTSVTIARIIAKDGIIATFSNRFGDGSWYWYQSNWWVGYYPGYSGYSPIPIPNTTPTQLDPHGVLYLFDNAKESRSTQVLLSLDKPYSAESPWSTTLAYTYTDAEGRLINNGDYQLDYVSARTAPYVGSTTQGKHRLVVTGSVDGPLGLIFGAKLVLETPRANSIFEYINTAPENGYNANYRYVAKYPTATLGYKTLDLQATKNFKLPGNGSMELRLDVLNVFDAHNYAQYIYQTTNYLPNGNILGVPRTLKLGLRVRI